MNATEQKQRHTAVADLARQVADVQTLAMALDERLAQIAKATIAAIDDERADRVKLAEEQLAHVDADLAFLSDRIDSDLAFAVRLNERQHAHLTRTFWQRVRWVFTGR